MGQLAVEVRARDVAPAGGAFGGGASGWRALPVVTAGGVDPLVALGRLRGVVWEWIEDAPEEAKAQPGMGVIAQEVEAVFPELVETDELGRKTVEYDGLIPPLMSGVGRLRERLAILERRLGDHVGGMSDENAERLSKVAPSFARTSLDPEALERVYPELVSVDEQGNKTVAYHGLVGPLIEAVKELDARVAALERAAEGRAGPD